MARDIALVSVHADERRLDNLIERLVEHKIHVIPLREPSPVAGGHPLILAWGAGKEDRDPEWRRLQAEFHVEQAGYDDLLISPEAALPDLLTDLEPIDFSRWPEACDPLGLDPLGPLVTRVRHVGMGRLASLRQSSLGAELPAPVQAVGDMQAIASRIGALARVLGEDDPRTRPLMTTLDEIEETYRVVKSAVERFVAAGLGSPQSMLASYAARERGVLTQSIRNGRAHCGRIWTRYAGSGGLRGELQYWRDTEASLSVLQGEGLLASADATFKRLREADYDLFHRMDSLGNLLTNESRIIVRYLLNGEDLLARQRVLQAREQLLVLESFLDTALAAFQEIEAELGYAEPAGSKAGEIHMSIHIGGDVVNSNVVAAETISRSSLTVASTAAPEDLKAALTELHKAVAALTLALPDDEAELAAKDLEDLTREATSGRRPAFLRRAADGLLAAAQGVAEVGIPVTELVSKIMALV